MKILLESIVVDILTFLCYYKRSMEPQYDTLSEIFRRRKVFDYIFTETDMRINYIKKVEMYDEETTYWADYDWNSNEKVWHCRDGRASEGFFRTHPDIPRTMTDQQMTLLAIKG